MVAAGVLLAGCGSPASRQVTTQPTCEEVFDWVMSLERQGDRSGAFDAAADMLDNKCPADYRVWFDYMSIKVESSVGTGRGVNNPCSGYEDFPVTTAAVELARQDGFCSGPVSGSDSVAVPGTDAGPGSGGPSGYWSCDYQPTYNRDWHDDVVCSNGSEQHRPYLREWDGYVTQDEIMASAREYERQLNAG
jgi:hypothetical protein